MDRLAAAHQRAKAGVARSGQSCIQKKTAKRNHRLTAKPEANRSKKPHRDIKKKRCGIFWLDYVYSFSIQ